MLHHVALEVSADAVQEEKTFWTAVGFTEVPAPGALGQGYTWFERSGTQIHLVEVTEPVIPAIGHLAVVAPDFDSTIIRLKECGFEVREGRRLWGSGRAKAVTPAGHTVELMASPPPPVTG